MQRELRDKWIAALRSGDYTQGQTYLGKRRDGKQYHCCLGVLMEVAGATKVTKASDEPDFDIDWYSFGGDTDMICHVDQNAAAELGMGNDVLHRLYYMNDSICSSFHEIADWIEEML